jgi:hypothetical protein
MPPPKQNPITPTSRPALRRSSSSMPARTSASSRAAGAALSAACAWASGIEAVPPSGDTRSTASAA